MTCNVDLLHVGIYTLAVGLSLMISASLNFGMLAPYEKQARLEERNEMEASAKQTLIQNNLPTTNQKQLNFRV
jgi:hypothetical protein